MKRVSSGPSTTVAWEHRQRQRRRCRRSIRVQGCVCVEYGDRPHAPDAPDAPDASTRSHLGVQDPGHSQALDRDASLPRLRHGAVPCDAEWTSSSRAGSGEAQSDGQSTEGGINRDSRVMARASSDGDGRHGSNGVEDNRCCGMMRHAKNWRWARRGFAGQGGVREKALGARGCRRWIWIWKPTNHPGSSKPVDPRRSDALQLPTSGCPN